MKIIKLAPLFIIPLLVTACGNKKNNDQEWDNIPDPVVVHLDASLSESKKETGYDLEFRFEDEYFLGSAKTYSKELALLSYGASLANGKKQSGIDFYTTMGYDNIKPSACYEDDPTIDTVHYFFAHKSINDFNLIALSFRGLDYGAEWGNNLTMGETGDHAGWSIRADEVLEDLKTYLADYQGKTLKLWISGYSRGAALANVISSKILREETPIVHQDNMFVYTFETPRGLTEEHAIAYENVFNLINNADPITKIAPEAYGLYRCGIDKDIYVTDVDNAVKAFDSTITLPAFTPSEGKYTTEPELASYIVNSLMKELDTDYAEYSMHTREDFYNNYEDVISYFMSILWQFSDNSMNGLMADFTDMSKIMPMLFNEDGFYEEILPYVQADEIPYDDETLKASCKKVFRGILNVGTDLLAMFLDESGNGKANITRCIDMHMPEVAYALLANQQ